ncbi:unnamed protein product [Rhizophagus irregularis]|uniref:Uncharacterized protein n=1 Tax=Rhizophagus irregularis TaxID=588596 RepID=A0A915ZLF9_9GLOM|nr:unnamed protein product [Rhizophagus irregularis]CAB5382138.1 unnamed protein product [Rhizophagus irregularis]
MIGIVFKIFGSAFQVVLIIRRSGKHPTNGTKIHLGGFPKNRKKEPRFVVFPGHEDCLPVNFKTFCLLILFFGKR